MAHGRFQQRFRRRFAVLFLQIFLQRAAVDADANRDVLVAGAVHHRANARFVTDVARVDAQAVYAVFGNLQRDAIIEMDIGDQRHVDLLLDQLERLGGVHGRNRNADDVDAHALQRFDLINRCFNIGGTGVGHRLHGNRRAITNRHLADVNACRFSTVDGRLVMHYLLSIAALTSRPGPRDYCAATVRRATRFDLTNRLKSTGLP